MTAAPRTDTTAPNATAGRAFHLSGDPAAVTLASLLSGGEEGQPPLTREQIIDTVVSSLPPAVQAAARALIANGVTDDSLAHAFVEVMNARSTPGDKTLDVELTGFQPASAGMPRRGTAEGAASERVPSPTPTRFSGPVQVDADGRVNGQVLPPDALAANDSLAYPNGNSADHVLHRFTVPTGSTDMASVLAERGDQPALPRQTMVDTVLSVMPAEQRAKAEALIRSGVSDASLTAAFLQVVEARKSEGTKPLQLSLVGLATEYVTANDDNQTVSSHTIELSPTTFRATLAVDAQGHVNGETLPVDRTVEILSSLRKLPPQFKMDTLRDAGLSEEWLGSVPTVLRDYAVAQVLDAAKTPGSHSLDLSYVYTREVAAGEDFQTISTCANGVLTLSVGADGTVNGKKPAAQTALAAFRVVEAMSPGLRRSTMQALHFPDDAISSATPEQLEFVLTKVSTLTGTPGDHQFQAELGGKNYAVGVKIGDDGAILGAATVEIPPPPKPSAWKMVVTVVCVVVSIVYPPLALVCQAIQGAIAISSGAKGLGLLAAVVGVGAGMASLAGMAGMANAASTAATLSTTAQVLNGTNMAITAAKNGDAVGAIAGALSAAAGVGGEFGATFSDAAAVARGVNATKHAVEDGDVLGAVSAGIALAGSAGVELSDGVRLAAQVASTADQMATAIKNQDVLALVAAGAEAVDTFNVATGQGSSSTLQTVQRIAETATAIRDGDYASATHGVMDLFGLEPISTFTEEETPAAERTDTTDVRRIDNAIEASEYEPAPRPEELVVSRSATSIAGSTPTRRADADQKAQIIDLRGKDVGLGGDLMRPADFGVSSADISSATVNPDSLRQNAEGNCYVLAPLASVAASSPGLIDSNVTMGSDGTATVRLFDLIGRPVYVVVDTALGVDIDENRDRTLRFGSFADGQQENLAASYKLALVQKAIAGAYARLSLSRDENDAAGYAALAKGGDPAQILAMLTGNEPSRIVDHAAVKPDDDLIAGRLEGSLERGEALVMYTRQPDLQYKAADFHSYGLAPGHAYSILGTRRDEDDQIWVRIRNPWGRGELGTMDGTKADDGVDDGVMEIPLVALTPFLRGVAGTSTAPREREGLRQLENLPVETRSSQDRFASLGVSPA